jgi:hypothetical protein
MDEAREIDWSTATVEDGTLTVELTGEPSRAWAEHMEAVIDRLESRRSASIKVTKRRIKVGSVELDAVDELRHLLESAVQQTNADLVVLPDERAPASTDGDEGDQALTDAFRALAPDA